MTTSPNTAHRHSRCLKRDPGFCHKCPSSSCIHSGRTDNDDGVSLSDESFAGKRKQISQPSKHQPSRKRKKLDVATTWDIIGTAALEATDLKVPLGISPFCLITLGHSAADCLQICHVIPRTLDEDNQAKLEFAWGLPYLGLNLDSRYNLMTLNATLHGAFDKGCWTLVPLDLHFLHSLRSFFNTPLQQMEPDVNRITKHYNGTTSFNYAFFPFPGENGMKIPLTRRNTWTNEPSITDYTTISYPYLDLPVLKSHIQPHFVIFDLISKFRRHNITLFEPFFMELCIKHPNLVNCIIQSSGLYRLWTSETPPDTFTGSCHDSNSGPDLEDNGGAGPSDASGRHGTRSIRRKKIAQDSTLGGNETSAAIDDGLYPDDSLTGILLARASTDDGSDNDDDEHVDDESDSSFYARLNNWLSTTTPGLPPPNDSVTPSLIDLPEPEPGIQSDCGSDSGAGSATLVGIVVDSKIHDETVVGCEVMYT